MAKVYNDKQNGIMRLGAEDIAEVHSFSQAVYHMVEDQRTYSLDSLAFYEEAMAHSGVLLGIRDRNGMLMAFALGIYPGETANSLGHDLGFGLKELHQVAQLESVMVHPRARGEGLQAKLFGELMTIGMERGYEHFLSSVHPLNGASVRSILKLGLKIKGLKKKYPDEREPQGYWRYIMHRGMKCQNSPGEKVAIAAQDYERQLSLLHQGMVGVDYDVAKGVVFYGAEDN